MGKGLEALGRITGTQHLTMYEQNECLKIIEQELKALEIIRKKGVNVGYFIHRLKENNLSYREYVNEQKTPYLDIYVSSDLLTQEEFDLLKEVLE